jgi:hypothetical protein
MAVSAHLLPFVLQRIRQVVLRGRTAGAAAADGEEPPA